MVNLIIFRQMYDLDKFFSGDVTLDEFVGSHHFDALTQDFCSDYDIYSAEKNNLGILGGGDSPRTEIRPEKEIYRDEDVLLRTLEEDGLGFYPGIDSVLEVVASEAKALKEEHNILGHEPAPRLNSGVEIEVAVEPENEITPAVSLKTSRGDHAGRTLKGNLSDEPARSTFPSFRTVPARLKVKGIRSVFL